MVLQISISRKLLMIWSIIFFSACSQPSEKNSNVYKTLNEGLERMNSLENNVSAVIMHSLDNKRMEPSTHYKAEIWYPKAVLVQKLSEDCYNFLEVLKKEFEKETGFDISTDSTSYKENKNVAYKFFSTGNRGSTLQENLENYRKSLLQVDPYIMKEFNDHIILTSSSEPKFKESQDFVKYYFERSTVREAFLLLSQFQNNVKLAGYHLISFCHAQIPSSSQIFRVVPIITLNTQHTQGGKEIELIAGIGSMATGIISSFVINNKHIDFSEDGVVHYKFETPIKPGKYKLPVLIKYIDQDGMNQNYSRSMEYTVTNCDDKNKP